MLFWKIWLLCNYKTLLLVKSKQKYWKSCDIIIVKHFLDTNNYKVPNYTSLYSYKQQFDTSSIWSLWSSTVWSQTSLFPLVSLPSPWWLFWFSLCLSRHISSYPPWHLASAICCGKARRQLAVELREPPSTVKENNCSSLKAHFSNRKLQLSKWPYLLQPNKILEMTTARE